MDIGEEDDQVTRRERGGVQRLTDEPLGLKNLRGYRGYVCLELFYGMFPPTWDNARCCLKRSDVHRLLKPKKAVAYILRVVRDNAKDMTKRGFTGGTLSQVSNIYYIKCYDNRLPQGCVLVTAESFFVRPSADINTCKNLQKACSSPPCDMF